MAQAKNREFGALVTYVYLLRVHVFFASFVEFRHRSNKSVMKLGAHWAFFVCIHFVWCSVTCDFSIDSRPKIHHSSLLADIRFGSSKQPQHFQCFRIVVKLYSIIDFRSNLSRSLSFSVCYRVRVCARMCGAFKTCVYSFALQYLYWNYTVNIVWKEKWKKFQNNRENAKFLIVIDAIVADRVLIGQNKTKQSELKK